MTEKRPQFKVYDMDSRPYESLGYANNKNGLYQLANKRIEETDGDCQVGYLTLNPETNKYSKKSLKIL